VHIGRVGAILKADSLVFAAARTKLKKLKKEEEAKKLAAASKNAADRSPHAKEVQ
jgi:hypothetical protein